jgi:hypothetical protein
MEDKKKPKILAKDVVTLIYVGTRTYTVVGNNSRKLNHRGYIAKTMVRKGLFSNVIKIVRKGKTIWEKEQ